MGAAISNVLRPGDFVWFEKTQGPPSESATFAWMVADEALGCTRAFLTAVFSTTGLSRASLAFSSCKGHLSDPMAPTPYNTIRAA
ncbi:hypothetical protein TNCV_2583151 [Trichonephila clavipes]|nr:hypothetical protein TNCV_2583151 [Trichonephila clavipes]